MVDLGLTTNRGSSPLARGKPLMSSSMWLSTSAHPRSRGENLLDYARKYFEAGSSPLARGKLTVPTSTRLMRRLIPARAGKTHPYAEVAWYATAHPRSRGENRLSDHWDPGPSGSSPLARGKRLRVLGGGGLGGLIPARAGKTGTPTSSPRGHAAHPRSRGENAEERSERAAHAGSSPLARGKLGFLRRRGRRCRLIPARAGKTPETHPRASPTSAHPRSRGENSLARLEIQSREGSSPLARGKLSLQAYYPLQGRLIPARAGKTPHADPPTRADQAHPRSRGENAGDTSTPALISGSSPLARGKPSSTRQARGTARLIPARAGKTSCRLGHLEGARAHPRSRGENTS